MKNNIHTISITGRGYSKEEALKNAKTSLKLIADENTWFLSKNEGKYISQEAEYKEDK